MIFLTQSLLITLVYGQQLITGSSGCNHMAVASDGVYVKCSGSSAISIYKVAINNSIPDGQGTFVSTMGISSGSLQGGCILSVNQRILVGGVVNYYSGLTATFVSDIYSANALSTQFQDTKTLQISKNQVAYNCHILANNVTLYTGSSGNDASWLFANNKQEVFTSTLRSILDSVEVNGLIYAVTQTKLIMFDGSIVTVLYSIINTNAMQFTTIAFDPISNQLLVGGWLDGLITSPRRIQTYEQTSLLCTFSIPGTFNDARVYQPQSSGLAAYITTITVKDFYVYCAIVEQFASYQKVYYVKYLIAGTFQTQQYATISANEIEIQEIVILNFDYVVISGYKDSTSGFIAVYDSYGRSLTNQPAASFSGLTAGLLVLLIIGPMVGCCLCIACFCVIIKLCNAAESSGSHVYGAPDQKQQSTSVINSGPASVTPIMQVQQSNLMSPLPQLVINYPPQQAYPPQQTYPSQQVYPPQQAFPMQQFSQQQVYPPQPSAPNTRT